MPPPPTTTPTSAATSLASGFGLCRFAQLKMYPRKPPRTNAATHQIPIPSVIGSLPPSSASVPTLIRLRYTHSAKTVLFELHDQGLLSLGVKKRAVPFTSS